MKSRRQILLTVLVVLPGTIAMGVLHWSPSSDQKATPLPTPIPLPSADGMIRLPGGQFAMGSPKAVHSQDSNVDAQPLHRVILKPFWLDAMPVTNRQFQHYVQQTDYETEAERRGSSLVFDRKLAKWNEVVGVNWRHPEGPNSSLVGKENYPVVHVAWQDAASYAAWADKRLPTEAEFEYAARGGLSDGQYPWGRELTQNEVHWANGWQGHYPEQDLGADGFRGPSPVGQFPPNRFGLNDMAGNVWNWCADWYAVDYYGTSLADNPRGPTQGTERVRRGGCWLSAANYGGALRVDYRGHAPPGESTNHAGFRCARSEMRGSYRSAGIDHADKYFYSRPR